MRVLLDECVPKRFKASFPDHDCATVPEAGFAGRKNGELLSLAEGQGFEVFVTLDKGIRYQQHLRGHKITIILIRARSNRLVDLLPYVRACEAALSSVSAGEIVVVPAG